MDTRLNSLVVNTMKTPLGADIHEPTVSTSKTDTAPVSNTVHENNETAVSDLAPVSDLETLAWLSFHRVWGRLSTTSLEAIAQSLYSIPVEADVLIYDQGQAPVGLYLLKWGTVEIYRRSPVGQTHIVYRNAGDLFGYVPLMQNSGEAVYKASAVSLSRCELWFLPQADMSRLLCTKPDIQSRINELLATDLARFASRMAQEDARIQGLQPYSRPVPRDEQVIGESKATQKLRSLIQTAAQDAQPVVLQAANGSGKTFVAAMIHHQSSVSDRPFAELDCAQLRRTVTGTLDTTALFGQVGGAAGVIELLERGTLLIDNVHLLSREDGDRLRQYLATHTLRRNLPPASETDPPNLTPKVTEFAEPSRIESWTRLILASPAPFELPEVSHHRLKLVNLSQRKADIPLLARHFLDRFCRDHNRPPLRLDQADLRRLISYPYPGNVGELAAILKRAVIMTPHSQTVIPEQVLWSVQSENNAFRIDLLNQMPWLRRVLLSDWWPQRVWLLVMALFIPVTVLGFLGPQSRESSLTLHFFWAWWWPGYLFLFAFVGRIWCAVCPFMVTAEWLRQVSLWLWPRHLLPWPSRWINRWGAWVLFGGFVAIYLWEKLWDLPHHAYLSAWLLLIITAGAVIFSLIYERRLWCRHLCPIGGMNGMFAKLSMVELRSTQQICGSQCHTFSCFRGSDATPVSFADALPTEGQATEGCPLYSHPAQLHDNRDCMLCMTCLKGCPNRSAQLNLRFPATDLLEHHRGFWAEAALLLLLLGGVLMHHSEKGLALLGLPPLPLDAEHLLTAMPIVIALLAIPAALFLGVQAIARWLDSEMPDALTVVYAYLPLTLATNLAHYIPAAMMEAGTLPTVMARTLRISNANLPSLTWSLDVAQFLQGVTLLSALIFSVYPLLRLTQRPLTSNLPHLVLMVGFTTLCFYLMM